jgi:hypothetical protein
MAFSNLFVLLDDIATVLDDVALMTKIAAKKTAGVLGDDLALNAEQVSGVRAERELPVVWAVAKGSFKNKLILVPAALLISALFPWLITPLLMIGGGYLCFEGVEKLVHSFGSHHTEEQTVSHAIQEPNLDLVAFEKDKIQGAIRTDFVLSAEIIVIALGTVQDADFMTRLSVVSAIAIVMTIGVYGLVAGIVKLDDAGIALLRDHSSSIFSIVKRQLGQAILWFAPALMKSLSVIGTFAMFLVGGSILLHGLPQSHELIHYLQELVASIGYIGTWLAYGVPVLSNLIFGLLSGGVILSLVAVAHKFKKAA